MSVVDRLPSETSFVIVGAGVAGAATAWALARGGHGPGLLLEQEVAPGMHASGRNAAIAHQLEDDPVILALAVRAMQRVRALDTGRDELLQSVGGLTLAGRASEAAIAVTHGRMREAGVPSELMPAVQARTRFGCLDLVRFETALWSPSDGVLDIHALLMRYLDGAKAAGFSVRTGCRVDDLLIEGGRVRGVRVRDRIIRAEVVVDASGAWAGRLGRAARLPLRPLRRHLFVTGPLSFVDRAWPTVWTLEREYYFRPESGGLLLSPCDETEAEPGEPPTDPAAATLLAEKLAADASRLADVTIRRSWACLRTFAVDRRPVIGPDPHLPGLFHVSGLGGFGMTTSAAVGELAATLLLGGRPDWIDPQVVAPARLVAHAAAP
jgi:D-arginine dehydrogenase